MLLFFAYKLFVNNSTCSLDLYSSDLQTTTVLFTIYSSSHKTDWILTTRCLICLVVLYAHANSMMKVLEAEYSCLRLLKSFIATSTLFAYFDHIACCCVSLSIPFSFIFMVFAFVTLAYCSNVKWYYTVFIWLTILIGRKKNWETYIHTGSTKTKLFRVVALGLDRW